MADGLLGDDRPEEQVERETHSEVREGADRGAGEGLLGTVARGLGGDEDRSDEDDRRRERKSSDEQVQNG